MLSSGPTSSSIYRWTWHLYSYRRGSDILLHRLSYYLYHAAGWVSTRHHRLLGSSWICQQSIWMCLPINLPSELKLNRRRWSHSPLILSSRRKPAASGKWTILGQSMSILWWRWSTFYMEIPVCSILAKLRSRYYQWVGLVFSVRNDAFWSHIVTSNHLRSNPIINIEQVLTVRINAAWRSTCQPSPKPLWVAYFKEKLWLNTLNRKLPRR